MVTTNRHEITTNSGAHAGSANFDRHVVVPGRICAVESTPVGGYTSKTGYLYDADGNRVARGTITTMSCDPVASGFQLTESYVLGQGGEELTQLDGNNKWQRTNVYGAGKLLATYDLVNSQPALHFQLTDPLGTRRMQTSAVGQPESLPFGDGLNSSPVQNPPATADDATPLHFTGKERDPESGNDYFGARYYASTMGRMLSPDPGFASAARVTDPQQGNMYAYARNNPLSITDPTGLDFNLSCGDNSMTCQNHVQGQFMISGGWPTLSPPHGWVPHPFRSHHMGGPAAS